MNEGQTCTRDCINKRCHSYTSRNFFTVNSSIRVDLVKLTIPTVSGNSLNFFEYSRKVFLKCYALAFTRKTAAAVSSNISVYLLGLLMRPEHSETEAKTETKECKTETETETKELL